MAENVDEAVSYFKRCDKNTTVRRNITLQLHLEKIERHAATIGLSPDHIIDLVDVAGSGQLAQTVSKRLVKALIPASHVPQVAVIKAVSWMCTNKPPMPTQCLFVRWLLVVYNFVDHYNKLHSMYGLFFQFLDTECLLPHVCHLLYLLTRREDVRMFRVRQLIQLQIKYGNRPYIVGLLSLYKIYYPNLVVSSDLASHRIFFRSFDRHWKEVVNNVQKLNRSSLLDHADVTNSQLLPVQPASKRRKGVQIPEMHSQGDTIHKDDDIPLFILSVDIFQVPFTQINGVQDLVENIDRVEFPSQIAVAISNHLLQHVIACKADETVIARFNYWLRHVLTEDVIWQDYNGSESFLQHLVQLSDFLQASLPVVDDFLHRFLLTWDGVSHQTAIYQLLARSRLVPFQILAANVLEPLRQLFLSSSVYIKCQVLVTLTELLHNYAAAEWQRHIEKMSMNDSTLSESSLPTALPLDAGFEKEWPEDFSGLQTLEKLALFTEELVLVGLQCEDQNSLLLYFALLYMDTLASMHIKFKVPFVGLPTTQLLGLALFSGNAACCSLLCSIMCKFKVTVRSLKKVISSGGLQAAGIRGADVTGVKNIHLFNHLLLDISDTLWRSRAFMDAESRNLLAGLDPASFLPSTSRPNSGLSLYRHQAFLPFILAFLRRGLAGELTHPQQLKPVRDTLVQFMTSCHLGGIADFISNFIRTRSVASLSQASASLISNTQ